MEISPVYSLEGLMLKLKLQYFGHLMWREELTHLKRPWCWERLKTGGEGDNRGWDGWMASPTRWTWAWASLGSCWWTGKSGVLQSMGSQRVRHDWATELNWTTKVARWGLKSRKQIQREFKINLFLFTLLWHTGYFELMAVETLWAPEKLLPLP